MEVTNQSGCSSGTGKKAGGKKKKPRGFSIAFMPPAGNSAWLMTPLLQRIATKTFTGEEAAWESGEDRGGSGRNDEAVNVRDIRGGLCMPRNLDLPVLRRSVCNARLHVTAALHFTFPS